MKDLMNFFQLNKKNIIISLLIVATAIMYFRNCNKETEPNYTFLTNQIEEKQNAEKEIIIDSLDLLKEIIQKQKSHISTLKITLQEKDKKYLILLNKYNESKVIPNYDADRVADESRKALSE